MKSQEVENRTLFRVLPAYEAQQCNLGVYLFARLLLRQAPLSPRRPRAVWPLVGLPVARSSGTLFAACVAPRSLGS